MKLIVEPNGAFEFRQLMLSVCDNINFFDASGWEVIYDVCNRYLTDPVVPQELGKKINEAFIEISYKEYLWKYFRDKQDVFDCLRQNEDIQEAVLPQPKEVSRESLIDVSMEKLVAYIYFVTTGNEDMVNRVIKYYDPYTSDGITQNRYFATDDLVLCIRIGHLFAQEELFT